jgi:hypothetical protein
MVSELHPENWLLPVLIRPEFSRHFTGSKDIAVHKSSVPPGHYAYVDALGCSTRISGEFYV